MRINFLKKPYTKCGGKARLRPSYKKNKITFKLKCWSLAFTLHKAFSKSTMRSGNSLATLFSPWFLKKNISHPIFY